MKKRIFIIAISIITIIIFLYTAFSKLAEYDVFREQIALSPILKPFTAVLVWMVPLIELGTAALLFFPKWRLYGLYISCGLMIAFSIYLTALFFKDEKLPCSCGGIIEMLSWKQHLLLNTALALLQALAIKFQKEISQEARFSY